MFVLLSFVLGIVFGSFFHVIGSRSPLGQSIVFPRSYCPSCQHSLAWFELVPVLSYVILKGRCLHCKCAVSLLYPLVELMSGGLFLLVTIKFQAIDAIVYGWLFVSLLIIIVVTDVSHMVIPDRVLAVFFVLFLLFHVFAALPNHFPFSIVGALTGFFVPLAAGWLSKGGIGGGDVKLLALLGFLVGWQGVLQTIFFACFSGTLFVSTMIVLGRMNKDRPIPFAPFIAIGACLVFFFGKYL